MATKRRKILYLAGGILIALALITQYFLGNKPEVETTTAQLGEIIQTIEDTGYVQAAESFDLQATQNARVAQVPVKIGESVKQGQPLVVLENLDLTLQREEVRSQLTQANSSANQAVVSMERTRLELEAAERDLERVQQLYEAGIATSVEAEKAQLQVDTYRQTLQEQTAQIDTIRAQAAGLEKTLQQLGNKAQQLIIKSPIDGIVLNLPVEIEQAAYPGSLLVSVGISDQLEVRAELLSDDMSAVKVGQKVLITAPVLGDKALTGEIKQIYPQAEEKQSALGVIQRRVPVIITLPQPDLLKPGYEVKAAIETLRQDDVLLLNREAVRTLANNQKEVMVVADGQVQHRIIETGINDRTQIVVQSGLVAGEQVVKDGSLVFKEGAKVQLKTAE